MEPERRGMVGGRDRLEIKGGSSSSSEDDVLSESSEASSSHGSPQTKQKLEVDVGATVEFSSENDQKEEELKKKNTRLTKRERSAKMLARRELDRMCMVKPDIVRDREKERALLHTATKGVVHLFNAVAERQKELDAKLAAKGKGVKRLSTEELGSAAFKKKLAQKLAVKDECETKQESSDEDVEAEFVSNEHSLMMDTSEIKTEPESDGE
ncbi:RRP15-like protein [Toxocara canis]|uniref:RRP15-like protein n=1 Tax=Toxocara canis TaxID=6265 RepID=A0A0B2US29_TOXCA|nr:RRP15-like protein [Toxocara canis]